MSRLATLKQTVAPIHLPFRPRLAISERRLLLVVGDLVLITISIVGSLVIWSDWAERILSWTLWREQALWALFIFLGWHLCLRLNNLYNLRLALRALTSVRRILFGGLVISVAYIVLFFVTSPAPIIGTPPSTLPSLTRDGLLPRLAPAMAIITSTCSLLLWRLLYAWALGGAQARRRVLILGAGKAGVALCGTILREHAAHYHIIGFLDDDVEKQRKEIERVPVLGGHEKLMFLARNQRVDEIVVAISAEVQGSVFQALMDCYEQGIAITPMPLLYERLTGKIAVEHIGSQWYIALPFEQHSAQNFFSVVKRVNDIVCGLLGCFFLLLLLPIVALLIRLDSVGPIFYNQERAGLHGRPFRVRKFRSMVRDAEQNGKAQWAVKGDVRVTRVGRILRKTRLDELPQMINVLRGEMSLVGPRPERPEFICELQHQIPFYRTRLAVKPGVTGWAQVNYGYGSTVDDALIKLQYDLYYVKHVSPWLDMLIMFRTIGVVFLMKGQ